MKRVLDYRKSGRFQNFDLILPTITLRLDKLVGGRRLNYHMIFRNELDLVRIEKDFLEKLLMQILGGEEARLNPSSLMSGLLS